MELKDFVFFKVHVPSYYYVTVAEVEDAEESGDTAYAVTHGESPCRLIVDSRHTPDQNYREWGSTIPVT